MRLKSKQMGTSTGPLWHVFDADEPLEGALKREGHYTVLGWFATEAEARAYIRGWEDCRSLLRGQPHHRLRRPDERPPPPVSRCQTARRTPALSFVVMLPFARRRGIA
jgi:hypothetical protein